MKYEFDLVVDGLDVLDDQVVRDLYDRCDDLSASTDGATTRISAHRAAPSLAEAIGSAVRDLENTSGVRVLRIEPDEYVYASEIAARVGRTRSSIDQLVAGKRGPGHFPPPITKAGTRNPLWRWSDVEAWFEQYARRTPDVQRSSVIAAMNGALEARRAMPALDKKAAQAVRALIDGATRSKTARPRGARPKAKPVRAKAYAKPAVRTVDAKRKRPAR